MVVIFIVTILKMFYVSIALAVAWWIWIYNNFLDILKWILIILLYAWLIAIAIWIIVWIGYVIYINWEIILEVILNIICFMFFGLVFIILRKYT